MIHVTPTEDATIQIDHNDGAVETCLTIDIDDARQLWGDLGNALRDIDEGPDPNGEPNDPPELFVATDDVVARWRAELTALGWSEITDPDDLPHAVNGANVAPGPRYWFNPSVLAMLASGCHSNTYRSQLASWYGVQHDTAREAAEHLSDVGTGHLDVDEIEVTSEPAGDRNFGEWVINR